jgi:4-amino-4-deoxy-L-arabinose transferase-like glycosyltransferase
MTTLRGTVPTRRQGFVVWLCVFIGALATAGDVGVVWDEPFFWSKEDAIGVWFRSVFGSAEHRKEALSPEGLKRAWPFCIGTPHENPPVWAILGETGHAVAVPILGELHARRLASAALFAGVAAGLFGVALRHWGTAAAFTALAAWVLHPRVFTHGRIGAIDMTMTAFWFFAACAFRRACEREAASWTFGPLWGLAIMSKFTALIAGPANVLWAVLYRRWPMWKVLAFAVILTPITMVAVHPGWWMNPIEGFSTAVEIHLHRHETQTVPTWYWGMIWPHALPWHNTLVLTFCCTPPAWMILAAIGLLGFIAGRGRDSAMGWAVINWAAMMLVRALPIAPGHDGIRQFLPAFPFLALMAAFGVFSLQRLFRSEIVGVVIAGLAVGSSAVSCWYARPAPLSYYSELVGGLKGAQKLGLESTYWWECVSPEFLEEMNRTLPEGAVVGLSSHGNIQDVFERYQKWGMLRSDVKVLALDKYYSPRQNAFVGAAPTHFLILRREGFLNRRDWPINERFRENLGGPALATVERQGVRLLALVKAEE